MSDPLILTPKDAEEFAAKVIPRVDHGPEFFEASDRFMVACALSALIRHQGSATPEEAKALCSDVNRFREFLERDPDTWASVRGFFDPGNPCTLEAVFQTLRSYLDLAEPPGQDL